MILDVLRIINEAIFSLTGISMGAVFKASLVIAACVCIAFLLLIVLVYAVIIIGSPVVAGYDKMMRWLER